MKELGIQEYDEMAILEKMKGILDTDRYYIETE